MKQKQRVKILSLLLSIFLLISIFAGCGQKEAPIDDSQKQTEQPEKPAENKDQEQTPTESEESDVPEYLNAEGFPIVKEPITLKGFGEKNVSHADWNEMLVFQEYEKMTNIKIEWNTPPVQGYQEKKNVLLASGDIPDIFYRANLSPTDEVVYGTQGVLIPLNDLIDKYAPNIKALFEKYPEIKKSITQPDGNIYSLPQATDSLATRVQKNWINKKWLDNLNLDVPTTIDEYYEVLKAFRDKDPNGNGQKDEIPVTDAGKGNRMFAQLIGSWGLGNKGTSGVNPPYVDLGPDGNLRFYPIDPRYKEVLEFINKLYAEGLLDNMVFVLESPEFTAKGDQGIIGGFFNGNSSEIIGQKYMEDYVAVPALKGPYGDQLWGDVQGTVQATGTFAITNICKYPEAAIRWIDYFYSEEGVRLLRMGVEGVTYTKLPDGGYQISEDFTNNPDGLSFPQAMGRISPWPGGGVPQFILEEHEKVRLHQSCFDGAEIVKAYLPDEVWKFTFTAEEIDQLTALQSDIHTYVEEMRVKFVIGEEPLSNWDNYVNTIQKMGLDELMKIYEKAYERWKNN